MSILLLHGDQKESDRVRGEAEAVLKHWFTTAPPLRCVKTSEVITNAAHLKGAAVAWLMIEPDDDDLFELIGRIQDRQLPAILTSRSEKYPLAAVVQDGVIACPRSTDPATCCAMLAALHSQATTLAAMRTELKLLRLHQAGVAGQIDKIDEELRLAAQLQREFLPTELPALAPLTFDVMWRPAGYVSGDIYDVERLDEHHVGMFLADAVGHGVPAALLTIYIKRSLATKLTDPDAPHGYRIIEPAEALRRLNSDMIAQQSAKVRFATAAYVVIDCRSLIAKVARAGHPFPMLMHAAGETEMLNPEGGLLGVFPEETYEQREVQLQPGDRLLLYSDGFELAFPEDAPREQKRIANDNYTDEFEKLRIGSLSHGLTELGAVLDVQAGSLNQRDDLTVLAATVADDALAGPTSTARTVLAQQQEQAPVSR